MVTLHKYLYGPWKPNTEAQDSALQAWVELVLRITDGVDEHVLHGAAEVDLREGLKSIRAACQSAARAGDLIRAADEFSALVKSYRARVEQTARSQSQDLHRILTTLNEALLLLAAGSTRTVGRLKQLETSLERATNLNDMAALKSKLAEILTSIREEVRQERAESQLERGGIERQIKQIRRSAAWLRAELPGREEAAAMIDRVSVESHPYCLVVFVLGRIREIIARYGETAANDLVAELAHRRISFPSGDTRAFRWSREAVVICLRWSDGPEMLSALLEPQVTAQFEHRLFLGARVAVLRVGLHWVVLPVSGPAAAIVEQIDRFAGADA
jgi:hypothetical protein